MTPYAKQMIGKLLLATFAGGLALVALEIALRLLPPGLGSAPPRDRPAVKFYSGETRLQPWSQNDSDALRIAVVGDSVTAASGCQSYDAYGMRLEALLNLNDGQRPAQVRIWAHGGESTDLELRYLKSILPWKPHVLILGICLNDAENAHNKAQLSQWRLAALPQPPSPRLVKVLRHTRIGSWTYQKLAARKARQGYLDYYRKLYDPNYRGWILFADAIRKFHATCREHEIPFVPVIFPLFSDVDRYPFDWVHAQIADLLQAEGLGYLDLLDVFRGQSPQRLQAIPLVDAHPNEIAHRQAAEALFQYLLANKLIDAGYLPQHSSASPERLWEVLEGFIYDVGAVDADMADQLIEHDEPPAPSPP